MRSHPNGTQFASISSVLYTFFNSCLHLIFGDQWRGTRASFSCSVSAPLYQTPNLVEVLSFFQSLWACWRVRQPPGLHCLGSSRRQKGAWAWNGLQQCFDWLQRLQACPALYLAPHWYLHWPMQRSLQGTVPFIKTLWRAARGISPPSPAHVSHKKDLGEMIGSKAWICPIWRDIFNRDLPWLFRGDSRVMGSRPWLSFVVDSPHLNNNFQTRSSTLSVIKSKTT